VMGRELYMTVVDDPGPQSFGAEEQGIRGDGDRSATAGNLQMDKRIGTRK